MSDIERRNLLNFCVVGRHFLVDSFNHIWTSSGGGPTGVEFSAELFDLLHSDIAKHYPVLARLAKITLYDVAPSILGMFDKSLIQ